MKTAVLLFNILLFSFLLQPTHAQQTISGNVPPTICRLSSGPLSVPTTNPALVTWTFPTTGVSCQFSTSPTCWAQIAYAGTTFSFDKELLTAASTSAVTFNITAHPAAMSILNLNLPIALPVTTAVPTGTTATVTCVGPPA